MHRIQVTGRHRRALALRELIVVVTVIALVILILAPGPLRLLPSSTARTVTCTYNLQQIGQAVAACFAENYGYGPTWDDGGVTQFMLTWTDLLYDKGYLPRTQYQVCPVDEHPDLPTEARAYQWRFYFVDYFGVNEPIKRGVRTSYALNAIMSRNFSEDKFEDPSRQVYALDGWWTWYACLNAAWALYEQATGSSPGSPLDWPSWEGTMVGWRHGIELSANALYLDGHVGVITPHIPDDPNDLLTDTVDTMASFTWLPGERNVRFAHDSYQGELAEYQGMEPYFTDPDEGTYKDVNGVRMPIDFPEELDCAWRTMNNAWVRLPNDPRNRR